MTVKRALKTHSSIRKYLESSKLIWFKPTDNFFNYFQGPNWKWRKFHDCGAGVGLLTAEMHQRNMDCVAYDMFARDQAMVKVAKFDTATIAEKMDWSEVALLARPCHHEDFIDKTINSALEMGEAFYIGLMSNLNRDLEQFEFEIVADQVGEDDEVLARIKCDKDNHHIQHKIKNYIGKKEWWWYSPGIKRYTSEPNGLAGFTVLNGEIEVLEVRHWANDLQDILSKQEACKDEATSGWIAPDGEWFGCGYAQHDYIARVVLGCSIKRLEQLKFCRCYGDGDNIFWTWGDGNSYKKKPTKQQIATLKAKGYDPKY